MRRSCGNWLTNCRALAGSRLANAEAMLKTAWVRSCPGGSALTQAVAAVGSVSAHEPKAARNVIYRLWKSFRAKPYLAAAIGSDSAHLEMRMGRRASRSEL